MVFRGGTEGEINRRQQNIKGGLYKELTANWPPRREDQNSIIEP